MTYDEWLKYAAQRKGNVPTMYRPDALAKAMGYTGQAQTMTGMGGSPSESTGEGAEAQYALTPEFEQYLKGFTYQPGMQGKNADVSIYGPDGSLKTSGFRTSDHTGSVMKAAGVVIPALAAGGFGVGALGAAGIGPMAAGAGDAWGATLASSLDGLGVTNMGAAVEGAATGGGLSEMIGTGAKAMADMGWGDWAKIGATLGSSLLQSNAVGNASDTQAAATAAATAEQRRQADRTYADYAPYRAAGVSALGQLQGDINKAPTAEEVMSQPGYQFGLSQGQQALDRKAAAGGGRVSGAALKSASQYATDYATTGYGAEYQRRQDRLNRLAALAGLGQTSTAGSAATGQASTNNITNLATSQANATGAGQLATGNIWANATNQLGALAGRWAQSPNGTVPG